jgi:hypothetical protein
MERTMNMVTLNAPAAHRRRMLRWAVIIGGMTVTFATGLLTGKSISRTAELPHAVIKAVVNQPATAAEPTTFAIVPSPVIEAHPQVFFGTGDGNGYWADRPRP